MMILSRRGFRVLTLMLALATLCSSEESKDKWPLPIIEQHVCYANPAFEPHNLINPNARKAEVLLKGEQSGKPRPAHTEDDGSTAHKSQRVRDESLQKIDNDNHGSKDEGHHDLLDALYDVISDASDSVRTIDSFGCLDQNKPKRLKRREWLNRLKKAFSSLPAIATMSESATVASAAMAAASVERERLESSSQQPGETNGRSTRAEDRVTKRLERREKRQQLRQKYIDSTVELEEAIAGAQLLSGSFQVISNTAGLLADSVRVGGDTAAGVMGASIKVAGTSLKAIGSIVTDVSRILDREKQYSGNTNGSTTTTIPTVESNQQQRQQPLTSERLMRSNDDPEYVGLGKQTKRVVAKSVRLVGNVIGGIGSGILVTGAAAESFAASTASVAEDTVRIVENLAGTVSLAVSLKHNKRLLRPAYHAPTDKTERYHQRPTSRPGYEDKSPSFLSYGSDETETTESGIENDTPRSRLVEDPSFEAMLIFIEGLLQDAASFGNSVSEDTEGVPSMARELFVALALCPCAAYLLFFRSKPQTGGSQEPSMIPDELTTETETILGEEDTDEPILPDSVPSSISVTRIQPETRSSTNWRRWLLQKSLKCLWGLVWIHIRALKFVFQRLFGRTALLLCIYAAMWAYLCRLSQHRAFLIQSRAEAIGFRKGMSSMGDSASPSSESVRWVNSLLERIWRVPVGADKVSLIDSFSYPVFVTRAVRQRSTGGSMCRNSSLEATGVELASCLPYGGLEPYWASSMGTQLMEILDTMQTLRPTDVAYVSLYSLSLGSHPPVIRSIKLRGAEGTDKPTEDVFELFFDLDAFLDDMSMVLEVKLSSLGYSLLPSTKVEIHSLEFRASVRAVFFVSTRYPFISTIKVSMVEQPSCSLRVTPLGDESGLKGIDLGSIPFISDWIKDAIKDYFSYYVSPKYVLVDVAAWFNQPVQAIDPTPSTPNLQNLRKRTRFSVRATPRTSTPRGVKITSVADKLEAHVSSTRAVAVEGSSADGAQATNPSPPVIVRPVTELSRLASDRHALKHSLVKPVTELSRLAMDRWLAAAIADSTGQAVGDQGVSKENVASNPLAGIAGLM